MYTPTANEVHEIAEAVAKYWRTRGITFYPYNDLYQDACLAILEAARKFDEDHGATFRNYAYTVASRATRASFTRARVAVSGRSNGATTTLGKAHNTADMDKAATRVVNNTGFNGLDFDAVLAAVEITDQVFERLDLLCEKDSSIAYVRPCLTYECAPEDLLNEEEGWTKDRIRVACQRARRHLRRSPELRRYAEEVRELCDTGLRLAAADMTTTLWDSATA